jgi:hypothetical protein
MSKSDVHEPSDRTTPEDEALREGREPPHHNSITGVAADAMRTGVTPFDMEPEQIPGEDALLQGDDPDADPLENAYSGDETPGGSNATPEGNDVDTIGRLYGVEEPEGELRLGEDLIAPRDENRWETSFESKAEEDSAAQAAEDVDDVETEEDVDVVDEDDDDDDEDEDVTS